MKHIVNVSWLDKMAFEANVNDHIIPLDLEENAGGENRGPRPKPLILASLGGCTAMDVVSILKKMKVDLESFRVEVQGELTEEHPKYYDKIHLKYIFRGKDTPFDKLEKAIELSRDKYCGVNALLSKGASITHEIIIE